MTFSEIYVYTTSKYDLQFQAHKIKIYNIYIFDLIGRRRKRKLKIRHQSVDFKYDIF